MEVTPKDDFPDVVERQELIQHLMSKSSPVNIIHSMYIARTIGEVQNLLPKIEKYVNSGIDGEVLNELLDLALAHEVIDLLPYITPHGYPNLPLLLHHHSQSCLSKMVDSKVH